MVLQGNIIKMKTLFSKPVKYYLKLSGHEIFMNDLIGEQIEIRYLNQIHCIVCGNKTKTSFGQGFCYPCFISAPEAAPCILKPELCEAHLGRSRDPEWAENNCLTEHYVYLAVTAGMKVGVTRASQIPTRWIDQGAVKAIKFAKTPNRYTAGVIEKELSKHISDKTVWQKMLKNEIDYNIDLRVEKYRLLEHIEEKSGSFSIPDDEIFEITYPGKNNNETIKSIDFEKTNQYFGLLSGIKGQYLIFKDGRVVNIRKYNGYQFEFVF
jgi:hypothetical protein